MSMTAEAGYTRRNGRLLTQSARLYPEVAQRKAPDWSRSPGGVTKQTEIGKQVSNKVWPWKRAEVP